MGSEDRQSMRNRKNSNSNSNRGAKPIGYLNMSFLTVAQLESDASDQDLIDGKKLSAKGLSMFGGGKDDAIMEKIVDRAYDAIEDYLKTPGTTVDDEECPQLTSVKTIVLKVYSVERHEDLFGAPGGITDEDEF